MSRRPDEHELVVNSEKCHVGRTEVGFVGNLVNYLGVQPLDAKVTPVAEYPESRTKRQFRQFMVGKIMRKFSLFQILSLHMLAVSLMF